MGRSLLSLEPNRLAALSIPVSTSWLLGSCMEQRGKQDLWLRQKPEVLEALRARAMVQSVESSNRIEGVTVSPERLKPVVLGKARPRDRSEEELAGYRQALDWIFTRKHRVTVVPSLLQRLHARSQGGLFGDAGEWKRRDNEIIEILPNGERGVRFVPTPAAETPEVVAELCRHYGKACEEERVPVLLIIAIFVLDLLCIHPFRDGNGRVSRLVTTLILKEHGFSVARFISLERLVEESKAEYYRTLEQCSQGWHAGRNEIIPWLNYFLTILNRAYRELEEQVETVHASTGKGDLARQLILAQHEQFTLGALAAQLPSVSTQLIKNVLAELKKEGRVRLTGRGRGALWEIVP